MPGTNSLQQFEIVKKFKQDAIADGWEVKPYAGEPIERAAKLSRDGWTISILTRDGNTNCSSTYRYEVGLHIWGPDRLNVFPPVNELNNPYYDWEELQKRVNYCGTCNTENIQTKRYSFAGRCCTNCLAELRSKHEKTGWEM